MTRYLIIGVIAVGLFFLIMHLMAPESGPEIPGGNNVREILGHKSRNFDEIVEVLSKTGTYTCPTLPHYRYDRVKRVCQKLTKHGFVKKSGKTDTGVNLIVTDLFKQWQRDFSEGRTKLGPVKYQKQMQPSNESTKP